MLKPLTVSELIKELKKLPPTCIVLDGDDVRWAIASVEYDSMADECTARMTEAE